MSIEEVRIFDRELYVEDMQKLDITVHSCWPALCDGEETIFPSNTSNWGKSGDFEIHRDWTRAKVMPMREITTCRHCGETEYWEEMRWLNGRYSCRSCYRKQYEQETGTPYIWTDLDGPRPHPAMREVPAHWEGEEGESYEEESMDDPD